MKQQLKTAVGLIACLLSFSLIPTSCSSDDKDEEQGDVQKTDGRKSRQLIINDVPITRATLTDNGTTIGAGWSATDKVTYFNLASLDYGFYSGDLAVSSVSSDGSTSTFSGEVFCDQDDYLALIYPKVTIEDGSVVDKDKGEFTISLSGQKGTLADIATNFHYIYGVGQVTSVTKTTAYATISSMQPLLALCKFTFMHNNDAISVKTLQIGYGKTAKTGYPQYATVTPVPTPEDQGVIEVDPEAPSGLLSITLDSETSDGVYVALLPGGESGSKLDIYFSVTTVDNDIYTGTASAILKAGKYYPVTLTLTKNE